MNVVWFALWEESQVMSLSVVRELFERGRRIRALSRTENRGKLHATILLTGAAVVMAVSLGLDLFDHAPQAADKARHYHAGRIAAAAIFYFAYVVIILRLLLAGRVHGSLTRRLLWIPAILAAGILVALLGVLGISVIKETFDLTGAGYVEWLDIEVGITGALSLVFPIALIMALTPILIPLDLLLQLPRLSRHRVHTGIEALDGYIQAQESRHHLEKAADVMLVEDDIVSATTVINFCRNLGLKCHHVSTIAEAGFYLRNNLPHLRLLILDNFLRVGDTGDNTTGSQWLSCISREFPVDTRPFRVVIISGYPEYLGDAAQLADLVLKKPWSPEAMAEFMARHGIVQMPPNNPATPPGSPPTRPHTRPRRHHARRHTRRHSTLRAPELARD
jgi:hypothetical protein